MLSNLHPGIVYSVFLFAIGLVSETQSQELEATLARTTFSKPIFHTAVSYDGADFIYIFGGYNGDQKGSIDIQRYSLSTDSLIVVAQFPWPMHSGAVSVGGDGSIYHFGGQKNDIATTDIYKFTPSTLTLELLKDSTLPLWDRHLSAVTNSENTNEIFLFSEIRRNVHLFNVESGTVNFAANITGTWNSWTATTDNKGNAVLFATPFSPNPQPGQRFPIKKMNLGTYEITNGPFNFPMISFQHATATFDGTYAYMIGGYNDSNVNAGMFRIEPVTMEAAFVPVKGFPGEQDTPYYGGAATYVQKLDRIYLFGGYILNPINENFFFNNIWYIDLNPGPVEPDPSTPVTEPIITSTTLSPDPSDDILTCFNKPDDMYPHPYYCTMFIICNGGNLREFRCPDPLHFDPVSKSCNFPDVVDCEIDCTGKPDGMYPHPQDCSLFIGCQREVLWVYKCPEPLLFDPIGKRCQIPELVDCK